MTDRLTPYDTGKRAEPSVWGRAELPRPSTELTPEAYAELLTKAEDTYGRVDFDDDEGATVATIYVEKNDRGHYVIHVEAREDVGLVIERG